MTKQELIERLRQEHEADYVMELLLKSVKWDFVRMCIKQELDSVEEEIKKLKAEGWIWEANGTYHVNWSKADDINGWNLTEEQQKAYDEARKKCSEVHWLLCSYNRLTSLLCR